MDAKQLVQQCHDRSGDGEKHSRAAEHHNDFGGFLGGPIQKDQDILFLILRRARLDQPQTQVVFVPSEYARTSRHRSRPVMNAYPQPDDRTVTSGVFVASIYRLFSKPRDSDATSLRIDHTFGDRFASSDDTIPPSQIIGAKLQP